MSNDLDEPLYTLREDPPVEPPTRADYGIIHLFADDVSVLLELRSHALPVILYWGPTLGHLEPEEAHLIARVGMPGTEAGMPDEPFRIGIVPEHHLGYTGRPGLSGHREGRDWSPVFGTVQAILEGEDLPIGFGFREENGGALYVRCVDRSAQLDLVIDIELHDAGVLRARATLTNTASPDVEPYRLEELSLAFPVPLDAAELLDFSGHWGLERVPQRKSMTVGSHLRESRRGRPGHDAAQLVILGEPGFGFRHGYTWSMHVGFSGNQRVLAERSVLGVQHLLGGELLLPGEVVLESAEAYQTPWIYGVAASGLDESAGRLHRMLRSRSTHPSSPRPVTLNVWEAVYFAHDLEVLLPLVGEAAAVGIERFVLDDGWFRGRRDDYAGLGDWFVDEDVWPEGLTPLVEAVRAAGMEFGLWFEPEMINLDSDLAREHPDWIMQVPGRLPPEARHQHVLNLSNPDAFSFLRGRLVALIAEYELSYIKWDHNRDLIDAGDALSGKPAVHEQTLALYRLLDELRSRFPRLEIESCASGGGRVDLGILDRTDRVWVSDNMDPIDRQAMLRWTAQLIPPELMGSHMASPKSHTTGRTHAVSFRAITAMFGHFGVEWDLTRATPSDKETITSAIATYKRFRGLLHSGEVVRVDSPDPSVLIHGVVSEDRSEALFAFVKIAQSSYAPTGPFRFAGLDPRTLYRVVPVLPDVDRWVARASPLWMGLHLAEHPDREIVLSGAVLERHGLQAPPLQPERAMLFRLTRIDDTPE